MCVCEGMLSSYFPLYLSWEAIKYDFLIKIKQTMYEHKRPLTSVLT